MLEFAPNINVTATLPIKVKPAGMACEVELFLGPNETTKVATSGRKPFTSTGAFQNVTCPVTMPSTEGIYHVYIDLSADGNVFAKYKGTEDIDIKSIRSVGIQLKNAPSGGNVWYWIWDPMIPDIDTVGYLSSMAGVDEIAWADSVIPTYIRSMFIWPGSWPPAPGTVAVYSFQSHMQAAGGYLPKIFIDSYGLYEYDCSNHILTRVA